MALRDTELHKAANLGEEYELRDIAKELDVDGVNARGAQGRTALHRALGSGSKACVEVLLEFKADPTIVDKCKRTSARAPTVLGHTHTREPTRKHLSGAASGHVL